VHIGTVPMNKLQASVAESSAFRDRLSSLGVGFAAWLLVACSGGGHSESQLIPTVPATPTGYGITAHVEVDGHPEQSGWVRVPPVDFQNWSTPDNLKSVFEQPPGNGAPKTPGQKSQAIAGPSLHTEATVRQPDGGVTDTAQTDADFNYAPGWSLLYWATVACFNPTGLRATSPSAPQAVDATLWVNTSPWRTYSPAPNTTLHTYYIFGYFSDEKSCDTQLLMQETLLCAADHLAQLGDSPGTVTWAGSPGKSSADDTPPGIAVTIPPQRTDDIFIARDMALNALAHIVRLDTKRRVFSKLGYGSFESTCVSQYANLQDYSTDDVIQFNGNTYFDPVPLDGTSSVSEFQAAGARRLVRKAKVLSGAARLTKDLIERSVQDDLSGAQQRVSAETDVHAGARQAWGADTTGTPYDSMRHALRTLFGRLEIGNNASPIQHGIRTFPFDEPSGIIDWEPHVTTRDDPECSPYVAAYGGFLGGGVPALDAPLLLPAVSARWGDVAPKTTAQAKAVSLLDSAGIILSPSLIEAGGMEQVRAAIMEVLDSNAAANAGYSEVQSFLAEPAGAGAAIHKAFIETLKDDNDVVFALNRVYGAFRLLTQPSEETELDPQEAHDILATLAAKSGLTLQTASLVDQLGGVVVKNGLPREELSVDPLASLSRLQHLSSCGVYAESVQENGPFAANNLEAALAPSGSDVTVFQNPFFLGEGFRRQLAAIADEAEVASIAPHVVEFARLAAAEVRQWAGPGTLLTEYVAGDPNLQNLYFVNISPDDLGVQSVEELGERLLLVSSSITDSSVVANCLAGLRKTCPSIPDPSATEIPSTAPFRKPLDTPSYAEVNENSQFGVARLTEGLDKQTLKISFPYSTNYSLTPGSFVVLMPKAGSPGQVLGWLRTPDQNSEFFAESYSREQRTLAARVFGIGKGTEPARSCTNFASLSLPGEYCVGGSQQGLAGMQRDQFVPLANELNSNSGSTSVDDSWKNYLDIAQAAADKADQLGEQLIKDGLENDLRKESATEELGNLCGSYVSVDGVKATNGEITNPAGDSQLSQCLNPETIDVVYLRDDPFAGLSDEAATSKLRALYCVNGPTDPPFCARAGTNVSHRGLGFATGTTRPLEVSFSDVCKEVRDSLYPMPSAAGGDNPNLQIGSFGNAIAEPWATSQGLANSLQGLHLEERADNQWLLTLGTRVIMGSDASVASKVPAPSRVDVWPYCLTIPLTQPPAGAAPVTDMCSDLANFVKDLFPPLQAPSDTNHTELRSQLEATLFYMGALAGQLPAGTMRMPIPVANRSNGAMSDELIPAPALYSQSFFRPGATELINSPGNLDPGVLKTLYTIADIDPDTASGLHYTGAVPWDGAEYNAMPPARTFSTQNELAYLTSRLLTADYTGWRNWVYQQALAGKYLYVDAANARIEFDPSLTSGTADQHSGRDTLQAWFTDRAAEFVAKDENRFSSAPGFFDPMFLQRFQEATYLTAPGQKPDQTTPPPPYRFCKGTTPNRGRHVCTRAPVSPVFHYAYGVEGTCDGAGVAGLESTIYAKADTECVEAVHTQTEHNGIAHVDLPPGSACSSPRWLRMAGGNPWFSARAAAGAQADNAVFNWNVDNATIEPSQDVCESALTGSMMVDTHCPSYNWTDTWGAATSRGIWQDRLKPSACPPEERLELFLDSTIQDRVVAMQTLVRVLGISCVASNQHVGIRLKDMPPAITSVEDINVLESWLNLFGYDVDQIANVLYLVDVPKDVVEVAVSGGSDVGSTANGERGKLTLDLESKLSLLENGFSTLGSNFQQLAGAIHKAKLDIQAVQQQTQAQSLSLAAAKIDNDRQRNKAYIAQIAGYAKLAVGAVQLDSLSSLWDNGTGAVNEIIEASEQIASSGFDIFASFQSDKNLIERQASADDMGRNAQSQAIQTLSSTTTSIYQSINDTITGLKTNNNGALEDIASLKQVAGKAKIGLAKASGADFMEIDGNQIPNHVNTVYRRQFDLTKQRYQLAIDSAKRSAYLARLSIEQRLGVRLDELHQNVGPLEAPATWVDSLCTVQGVDYNKFRQATQGVDAESDAEIDTVKGFASQFIGDYVGKLRQFVQFYNVQFPFVDANDVAVVSLREDLQGSLAQCIVPSANLLQYSDALSASSSDSSLASVVSHGGWRVTQCAAGTCLQVKPAGAMVNTVAGVPAPLAPPGNNGQATLLRTIAEPANPGMEPVYEYDAGEPGSAGASGALARPSSPAPAAAVFQTVSLRAKSNYVLSWWDMARSPDGSPITTALAGTSRPYTAAIFDGNWARIASESYIPATPVSGTSWSERRLLQAVAPVDGEYHIVFTAGPPGDVQAAIAIANVQLETGAGNGADAGPYESNGASVFHTSGKCSIDTPEQFRTRFTRKCDSKGCYFELKDVLNIDTQVLNQGASSLLGKLAPGNYNYRNNTVALNVVGTGVIDCSQQRGSSCNGSAYLQYDLDHIAYNVPIEDYEGGTSCFDFGAGAIKGGKALASERFLTLPLGASDRETVNQSPFLKPEFSGRPLSGAYRLRIHDEPQLVWRNVDDVQLVMNYGYWSRVARSPGN